MRPRIALTWPFSCGPIRRKRKLIRTCANCCINYGKPSRTPTISSTPTIAACSGCQHYLSPRKDARMPPGPLIFWRLNRHWPGQSKRNGFRIRPQCGGHWSRCITCIVELLPNCYDEWILPERDRWRQAFLQAAERLIALLEEERDYDAAIRAAPQLLRQDSLHEPTYRQLMRLYGLRGDRAAALRVYHTCVTVLERELGTDPSEVTRAVYESLLQSDTSPKTQTGPLALRGTEAPLLGRKAEWRHLQEAWRKAAGGHPHVVILSGEAGIGKTRLAEEIEAWVSRQGMTTASARCYAALGHLAYAPVTTWLRTEVLHAGLLTLDPIFLTEISRLLPELQAELPALP